MCPARASDSGRGFIIPIGGAEERLREGAILRRFIEHAGGPEARVAVIPTASRRPEAGQEYDTLFRAMGVAAVKVLRLEQRAEAEGEAALTAIADATGVFLTGGDQLRLSTTLGGTGVARLLRRRNAAGVPIAGTSAGASFLSEHMIARGQEGSTPRADMVALAPGLGLTNRMIIDQLFHAFDLLPAACRASRAAPTRGLCAAAAPARARGGRRAQRARSAGAACVARTRAPTGAAPCLARHPAEPSRGVLPRLKPRSAAAGLTIHPAAEHPLAARGLRLAPPRHSLKTGSARRSSAPACGSAAARRPGPAHPAAARRQSEP